MPQATSMDTSTSTRTLEELEAILQAKRKLIASQPSDSPKPIASGEPSVRSDSRALWNPCDGLYRHQAADWIEGRLTARTPPTGWSFVTELVQYHAALRRVGSSASLKFSPQEQADRDGFWRWYGPVKSELSMLFDLLAACVHDPDRTHAERLIEAASNVKDQYRAWIDTTRIAWLPEDWAIRLPDGSRERCNIVERLTQSIARAGG